MDKRVLNEVFANIFNPRSTEHVDESVPWLNTSTLAEKLCVMSVLFMYESSIL